VIGGDNPSVTSKRKSICSTFISFVLLVITSSGLTDRPKLQLHDRLLQFTCQKRAVSKSIDDKRHVTNHLTLVEMGTPPYPILSYSCDSLTTRAELDAGMSNSCEAFVVDW
jgi:hypothetical protein